MTRQIVKTPLVMTLREFVAALKHVSGYRAQHLLQGESFDESEDVRHKTVP